MSLHEKYWRSNIIRVEVLALIQTVQTWQYEQRNLELDHLNNITLQQNVFTVGTVGSRLLFQLENKDIKDKIVIIERT